MKSRMWLLDPRPKPTTIIDMVENGFELSEAPNTPVMAELRVRACHMTGSFVAKDYIGPPMAVGEASANLQQLVENAMNRAGIDEQRLCCKILSRPSRPV